MMPNRNPTGVSFFLRFYEQTGQAIAAVVENARRSHSGIVAWTEAIDPASPKRCTIVTLRFRDLEALGTFMKDELFIETYLRSAWGRLPLTRTSLRTFGIDEIEPIPSDLFTQAGI